MSSNSEITAEQLTDTMLVVQAQSSEERAQKEEAFWASIQADRDSAKQQHAQHPKMPTYCIECHRYYEHAAQWPVEILIKAERAVIGDEYLQRGDITYICTRCIQEIADGKLDENNVILPDDFQVFEVVALHKFFPPWY